MLVYEAARSFAVEQLPGADAGRHGRGHPAGQPAAARAGAAGRPRHGRLGAGPAAGVVDGLRRPGPRRGDVRAARLHGVAARRPDRASRCWSSTRCWPPAARCCTAAGCWSTAAAPTSPCCASSPRPAGIERLADSGLPMRLVTAAIDERLNEQHVHRPGPRRRRRPPVRRHAPLLAPQLRRRFRGGLRHPTPPMLASLPLDLNSELRLNSRRWFGGFPLLSHCLTG